jgi:hypothetical protein
LFNQSQGPRGAKAPAYALYFYHEGRPPQARKITLAIGRGDATEAEICAAAFALRRPSETIFFSTKLGSVWPSASPA